MCKCVDLNFAQCSIQEIAPGRKRHLLCVARARETTAAGVKIHLGSKKHRLGHDIFLKQRRHNFLATNQVLKCTSEMRNRSWHKVRYQCVTSSSRKRMALVPTRLPRAALAPWALVPLPLRRESETRREIENLKSYNTQCLTQIHTHTHTHATR